MRWRCSLRKGKLQSAWTGGIEMEVFSKTRKVEVHLDRCVWGGDGGVLYERESGSTPGQVGVRWRCSLRKGKLQYTWAGGDEVKVFSKKGKVVVHLDRWG